MPKRLQHVLCCTAAAAPLLTTCLGCCTPRGCGVTPCTSPRPFHRLLCSRNWHSARSPHNTLKQRLYAAMPTQNTRVWARRHLSHFCSRQQLPLAATHQEAWQLLAQRALGSSCIASGPATHHHLTGPEPQPFQAQAPSAPREESYTGTYSSVLQAPVGACTPPCRHTDRGLNWWAPYFANAVPV
jgi:hypothetical protein